MKPEEIAFRVEPGNGRYDAREIIAICKLPERNPGNNNYMQRQQDLTFITKTILDYHKRKTGTDTTSITLTAEVDGHPVSVSDAVDAIHPKILTRSTAAAVWKPIERNAWAIWVQRLRSVIVPTFSTHITSDRADSLNYLLRTLGQTSTDPNGWKAYGDLWERLTKATYESFVAASKYDQRQGQLERDASITEADFRAAKRAFEDCLTWVKQGYDQFELASAKGSKFSPKEKSEYAKMVKQIENMFQQAENLRSDMPQQAEETLTVPQMYFW